ncbi:MAG: low-density lipoprotein receptor class A repeat-containing protein, partial [Candidatus Thermoplasmatota archaeon]|nr:low-density lipoprotein receptor class A repeat-containing protein [Candidatus Thermoplasmatota archaeon]
DNPFDCKNGETIHGSKVLDGEDDCSNGHDEKDPIFSTSDAQNYQSEEPFLIGLFLSCCIPIVIAFSIYSAKETFHNNKLEILQKELSGAEARVKKVEDRLNMKIQLRKLEESRQRKIKNDNVKIKGLEKKIEEEKEYFESIKVKIKTLEQKKKELYDSISHLIPYSDLI